MGGKFLWDHDHDVLPRIDGAPEWMTTAVSLSSGGPFRIFISAGRASEEFAARYAGALISESQPCG